MHCGVASRINGNNVHIYTIRKPYKHTDSTVVMTLKKLNLR